MMVKAFFQELAASEGMQAALQKNLLAVKDEAETAEIIAAFAREAGFSITTEQIVEYLHTQNKEYLKDLDLEGVAGGFSTKPRQKTPFI